MRTFPVVAVLALLLVGACALDILRTELNIRAVAASNAEWAEREDKKDKSNIARCAAGQTSMIFYKGVYCNGR